MSKIIGVTVGTPISPNAIREKLNPVLSVNGVRADKDGNVGITIPEGSDGISATHSWNGTVLTVTSASGTSAADLQGPAGKDGSAGKAGADGKDGSDGFSPIVSVTPIDGGHRVGITDVNGTKVFDVMDGEDGTGGGGSGADGKDGKDGVSVSSVVQTTTSTADGGTNIITVTLSNGATSTFQVKNGSKGSTGADGYTPQKNVDYFDGEDGADGVGVQSVTQTTTSTADGGENVITVTLTNGTKSTFKVKNGSKGSNGSNGSNGVSATHSWSGSVLTVTSASGTSSADLRGPAGADGKDGSNGKDGADGKDATINGVNALTIETDGNISATMNGSVLTLGLAKVPNTSQSAVITLSASGWTEQSNGRFTQTAAVSFMTADAPVVNWDVYLSGADVDADDTMEEAYLGNVYRVVPNNGSVTVWAREVPDVNIQMTVGVS